MFAKISRKYNIPKTTVNRWHTKFQQDPTWRPYHGINHGMHLRYFTDEEEAALATFIRENFIKRGYIFTNLEFQKIARHAYFEKHFLKKYVLEEDYYADIQQAQINAEEPQQAEIDPDESDFAEGEDEDESDDDIFIDNEFADDEREYDDDDDDDEDEMADDEDALESEPEMEFTEEDDDEYDIEALQNVLMGPHFIANFKKRNHFSSRRTRVERRSGSTPEIIAGWGKTNAGFI